MARTRRSELAAYHEAGHAVVGLYLGMQIDGVLMRGRHGFPVTYWTERRPSKGRTEYTASTVIFGWAGYCAERAALRRWGKSWPKGEPRFWKTTDYARSRSYMQECGIQAARRRPRIARLEKSTRALVENLWPAIEALAKALLKRRAMRFKGIRTVVLKAAARHGL